MEMPWHEDASAHHNTDVSSTPSMRMRPAGRAGADEWGMCQSACSDSRGSKEGRQQQLVLVGGSTRVWGVWGGWGLAGHVRPPV